MVDDTGLVITDEHGAIRRKCNARRAATRDSITAAHTSYVGAWCSPFSLSFSHGSPLWREFTPSAVSSRQTNDRRALCGESSTFTPCFSVVDNHQSFCKRQSRCKDGRNYPGSEAWQARSGFAGNQGMPTCSFPFGGMNSFAPALPHLSGSAAGPASCEPYAVALEAGKTVS